MQLCAELEAEVRDHCGIRREFVFSHADGDPAELFLLAMAWGFGLTTVHWPSQRKMLTAELPRPKLALSHISGWRRRGNGCAAAASWVMWPGCLTWFAVCRLGGWRGSW
jgi:hypothetical protein